MPMMPYRHAPIRARDVRAHIKELGFEKGVIHSLELLCEEFVAVRQQLVALADIQHRIIEQMNVFMAVGEGIRDKVQQMERDKQQGDAIDRGDIG